MDSKHSMTAITIDRFDNHQLLQLTIELQSLWKVMTQLKLWTWQIMFLQKLTHPNFVCIEFSHLYRL